MLVVQCCGGPERDPAEAVGTCSAVFVGQGWPRAHGRWGCGQHRCVRVLVHAFVAIFRVAVYVRTCVRVVRVVLVRVRMRARECAHVCTDTSQRVSAGGLCKHFCCRFTFAGCMFNYHLLA